MIKVEVIGNLGADAEVKNSQGSKFVAFRVASTDKWKDDKDQVHEDVTWIDCTMNNVESKILPYLKKGVKVFVRGNGKPRLYSSPTLRKMVASIQCSVMEVELCGGQSELVPRDLIDPQTGNLLKVNKYYCVEADTKAWEKDDSCTLIDKGGRTYKMVKGGWVAPEETQSADGDGNTQVDESSQSSK